jgi:ABC-2 type transport system ATP-binding protein
MISLASVHKAFGSTLAVRDVSLHVPRGQILGLLGPNGAGKTTTARLIVGAIAPSRGRVEVDGLDTLDHPLAVRGRLGYLPESNPLHPEMTVLQHLRFRARLHRVPRARRAAAVGEALERCDLAGVRGRPIGDLSKGFRQRVGLAAAMVHDPPVLILDEPTAGLDPEQVAHTRALVRGLAGERTVLLISHLLPEVERTCDRVVIFARGEIGLDVLTADAAAAATDPILVEVAADRALVAIERIDTIEGVRSVAFDHAGGGWSTLRVLPAPGADPRARIVAELADDAIPLREIHRRPQTLESLYLECLSRVPSPDAAPGSPPEAPA